MTLYLYPSPACVATQANVSSSRRDDRRRGTLVRMTAWPKSVDELTAAQRDLATSLRDPWVLPPGDVTLGGCFVCFEPGSAPGGTGERAWAAAALLRRGRAPVQVVVEGHASARYRPGLLALREGPLLEDVVRGLPVRPEVLLVNATGRDHPRRAGLALHLGAVLDLPTVGVTDRTLLAEGPPPGNATWSRAPLLLEGEVVGAWLRTRAGVRPVAVHAAWRTDVDVGIEVLRRTPGRMRTPEPIRLARQAARRARASASGPSARSDD
jgi:deoxyribonuclease V